GIPYRRLICKHDLQPGLPFKLIRTVFELEAELLHTHLVHADVYGALVPGVPLVSTKHNPDPFRTGAFRNVEHTLARRARKVIAISETVRRFSAEEGGLPAEKVGVVRYGLDEVPRPLAANPSLGLPAAARPLCCVAR